MFYLVGLVCNGGRRFTGRPHPEVAAGLWLSAASAFAQDAPPGIVLHLRPDEVAEIARLVDLAAAAQS